METHFGHEVDEDPYTHRSHIYTNARKASTISFDNLDRSFDRKDIQRETKL